MSVNTKSYRAPSSGSRPRQRVVFMAMAVFCSLSTPAAVSTAHQTSGSPEAANPIQAIEAVTLGIIEADNRGDLEAVIGFYADDAVLIPPNGVNVEGRVAIRKHYQAIFAAADLAIESHPQETWVETDLAFQRGWNHVAVHAKSSGEVELRRSKYLMILRRVSSPNAVQPPENAGWKIFRLMWTDLTVTDMP